ncbi:MAG: hypothetical protein NVSMB14_06760 [Isosphaeraceae bacterium]
MSVLNLNEFRGLFKNEASYEALVDRFRKAVSKDGSPIVLSDDEILFTAFSPKAAKDILCRRIVNRFAENPKLLDEIQASLDDEIVS